ncbi:MAG TPA: DciA family protein [Thermoleophilaceae bacterium]|nr:DciA family protein [Thermoleophilaceae bacterium]
MRRTAPRRLELALGGVLARAEPATLLARVQSAWPGVAGPALAASTRPASEREGTITVACDSAVWAHELELLAAELLPRLNKALASGDGGAEAARLRFVVGSGANRV